MSKEIAIDKLTIGNTLSTRDVKSEDILIKQDDGSYVSVKDSLSKLPASWIKTVNGIEAIDGDISLNDDISETMTNYPVFRTGTFGNGVYVAAKKSAGLSWSDDGKTFNACTLNDGSEFNSGDIRVLKFLNGKFFGIDNASYGANTVKIYVSSDGKTWKITKEIPGISRAFFENTIKYGLIYDGKRYLITGEDVSFSFSFSSDTYPCDKTYAFLFASEDGETWTPINLTYTAKDIYDIPFASNLAKFGNGYIAVNERHETFPEKKYIYFELTDSNQIVNMTEFNSTVSGIYAEKTPWSMYSCDEYVLIGYDTKEVVKITKTESGFKDELISTYNTDFGIARNFCEYEDAIFAVTYSGKILKISKDLTTCSVIYSSPVKGEFNGIFVDDIGLCAAGFETIGSKECGVILRYSKDGFVQPITADEYNVNDYVKALTPATTADETMALVNNLLKVLKVMKFA